MDARCRATVPVPPDEVFDDPANLFVTQFVGEPQINVLRGTVRGRRRRAESRDRFPAADVLHTVGDRGRRDGTKVVRLDPPARLRDHPPDPGPGSRRAVACFEAPLLEFGLATSTGGRGGGGHRRPDTRRPRGYEPNGEVVVNGTTRARLPVRPRNGGAVAMTKLFNDPARFTRGHAGRIPRRQRALRRVGVNAGGVVRARETSARQGGRGIGGGSGHLPGVLRDRRHRLRRRRSGRQHLHVTVGRGRAQSVRTAQRDGDAGVLLTTGNYAR